MHVLVLLVLVLGCKTPDTNDTHPAIDLVNQLDQPGKYAVGYRSDTMAYTVDGDNEQRSLRVALWYPSNDSSGTDIKYQDIFAAPNVWKDADTVAGPHPVMIYSHGHQGYAEASGRLMAHFASHGWMVAAPDHTDNTTWDGPQRSTEIYYQRPLDISATLDYLGNLPASDPLSGNKTDEVIALGHSFGGYTTFALAGAEYPMDVLAQECADGTGPGDFCSTMTESKQEYFTNGFYDERLLGIVPMAPGDYDLFQEGGLEQLELPAMHMTGELDPAASASNDLYWTDLAGHGHRRIHILGGGHQTFTDFSGILEQFDGLIGAEEVDQILRVYTLAFAQYLLGQTDRLAVLDGTHPVSESAVISE